MRRLSVHLALCISFSALVVGLAQSAAAQTGGLRYTITVGEFENRSGWTGQIQLGNAWATIMTDVLNQSEHFIVLAERPMRAAALEEQDLAASGRTAQGGKAPATGHLTPAQLVVKGAITHVQDDAKGKQGGINLGKISFGGKKKVTEINATIYLMETTTGQVLSSTSVVGISKSRGGGVGIHDGDVSASFSGHKDDNMTKAITAAVAQTVEWLVAQLPRIPWRGSVVMVEDQMVYINRGSREGVQAGWKLVVGEEKVIRDPDTGEVLDQSFQEVAQLEAVQVKEKLSVCRVITGDTLDVRKGLSVELALPGQP